LKLTHEDYDQLTVVAIRGELHAEACDTFRDEMSQRLEQDVRDFVLNLSETESIDSQGLEALLWLQDCCAEQLGQVRLAHASPSFREVLRVTRLAGRLDCHEDVDAAITSLR
jgi:anti-sigma B factor antagonist